jgi:L-aspartate oxidase
VGRALSWQLPEQVHVADIDSDGELIDSYHRSALRSAMSRYVGVLRTPEGLIAADAILQTLAGNASSEVVPTRKSFEATNMLTIATAVVAAALARKESRGCHRRTDFDAPSSQWQRHLTCRMVDGKIEVQS